MLLAKGTDILKWIQRNCSLHYWCFSLPNNINELQLFQKSRLTRYFLSSRVYGFWLVCFQATQHHWGIGIRHSHAVERLNISSPNLMFTYDTVGLLEMDRPILKHNGYSSRAVVRRKIKPDVSGFSLIVQAAKICHVSCALPTSANIREAMLSNTYLGAIQT